MKCQVSFFSIQINVLVRESENEELIHCLKSIYLKLVQVVLLEIRAYISYKKKYYKALLRFLDNIFSIISDI